MTEARSYYLVTPLAYTGAAAAFTYHYEGTLATGQIVQIPLGRRSSLGVITEIINAKPSFATKAIKEVLELPPIPAHLLALAGWMSDYYACSPSSVWTTFLPTGLTKKRRIPKPKKALVAQGVPVHELTPEQTGVLASVRASSKTVHLIQGVTGSGKTRLYLELAAEALAAEQSVVILVPEITLTPQVVGQFETAFGDRVLTTHSKLTEAQRDLIWRQAVTALEIGEPRIVVGPRSSLFLPLHKLGLIVIDECHETSYKQDQHPRYHTLAVAAKLGQLTGARVVFGSATPGLNELFLAQEGRIEHHLLTQRVHNKAQPEAKIIDLRNKDLFKLSKFITQPLIEAVTATLAAGRQSLLYMNRRGSASSQVCADCGHVTVCPTCQLPLTFHADLMRLVCHHCNFRQANAAVCPECNGASLRLLGGGTKRIEAEVAQLWPEARIARLDRDSANLQHIGDVYAGLRNGTIDIIIGTQMIAKGLDFPGLDTVGIISADTMLHIPDFSAAERTYQLITQVSGRAGRGGQPGQVFIQTYTPDHPAIVAAATGAYDSFATAELAERQALSYPPYKYLLKLTVAAKTREAAMAESAAFAAQLRRHASLDVAGPAPAFLETPGGKFHWVTTVKASRRSPLVQIAQQVPGDHWTADLDPLNLL
jgi:primosomal protein N' (replication factor Y)